MRILQPSTNNYVQTMQNKLQRATSQLVVIDMQEKLGLAMQPEAMQSAIERTKILLQVSELLNHQALVTEQYPQGLGSTFSELAECLGNSKPIAKTAFSACDVPQFTQKIPREKTQIILTGMEAHICVLQTALDFLAQGKQVFVVEDAVISRAPANKDNAIARLHQAGCIITNTESVVFEWIGGAEHEHFKAIAKLIR